MTKEEKTRVEVLDEVEYVCSPVRHGKEQVGFAPRIRFKTTESDDAEMDFTKALESMIDTFGNEKVFSLADRQYDQDSKNAVRAKFTKGKVSASQAIKFHNANPDKWDEIKKRCTVDGMGLIEACEISMGVGKDAKVEPEKVHWDIL